MKYHELTKADVAALRQCDNISIHLRASNPDQNAVRASKRLERKEGAPFADTERTVFIGPSGADAPVAMQHQYDRDTTQAQCFGHLYSYPSQHCETSSIMRTLRAGDEVCFVFWPDAGTNGYAAAAGLHVDRLYLRVRRDGRDHANWQLDEGCCPSNSARMVRGVPNSASYERDAERARSNV